MSKAVVAVYHKVEAQAYRTMDKWRVCSSPCTATTGSPKTSLSTPPGTQAAIKLSVLIVLLYQIRLNTSNKSG